MVRAFGAIDKVICQAEKYLEAASRRKGFQTDALPQVVSQFEIIGH
jgi:hypothetical protein